MRRVLLRGVAANIYGQLVIVAIQVLSIPVFIHAWGPARYGLWLVLSALPSAFSIADFGLVTSNGAAMTAAVAQGNIVEANRLLRQSVGFVASVSLVLACVAAPVAAAMPLPDQISPAIASACDVRLSALALLGVTLSGLGLAALDTAFRASRLYAVGVVTVATIRLIEAAGALAAALAGGGLLAAAGAMLGLRVVGLLAMSGIVRRRISWVRWNWRPLPWADRRFSVGPALAALAVPAGLAINLQGMTAIAGLTLPLAAVPVFTAARTLTRLMVQAVGLVTHALMPELARAVGQGDAVAAAALVRLNRTIGIGIAVPGFAALVFVGPELVRLWTGSRLQLEPRFLTVMAAGAACHAMWLSRANLLLATNRQAEFSYAFVAVAVATCGAAVILGSQAGLIGLATALLLGDGVMFALIALRPKRRAPTLSPILGAEQA